jgi:anaerobic magnesium-protoporphyrin IX monomethyl ester cyclase
MKKIILIYPKTGIDPDIPHPPLSILSLCGLLENNGYIVVLIDERIEKDVYSKIKNNLADCLFVGFSVMTGFQIKHALKIAKFIRNISPNIPLVWGGVHVTFLPEQSCKNEYIDIIVRGEGDISITEVAKHLEKGKSFEDIKGITYKKNGKIISNSGYNLIDLNLAPRTPWHLINVRRYLRKEFGTEKVITISTSRGCPHKCNFCYNSNFNNSKWRARRIDLVIEEIVKLKKEFDIQGIYLIDDNFFVDKKRVFEFCSKILEKKIDIVWATTCRVDYFSKYDDDFLSLLWKSGCRRLFFGVESGSKRILELINKGIIVQQVLNTAKKCHDFGILPEFSFMAGFPSETRKERIETLNLIDKILTINPDSSIGGLFLYTAYPGTPLFELATKNGFVLPASLEEWSEYSVMTAEKKSAWLKPSEKREIQLISFVVRIVFNKELIKKTFKNPFYKLILVLFKVDGKLRWKFRFFKFAPEWYSLQWYYKKLSIG